MICMSTVSHLILSYLTLLWPSFWRRILHFPLNSAEPVQCRHRITLVSHLSSSLVSNNFDVVMNSAASVACFRTHRINHIVSTHWCQAHHLLLPNLRNSFIVFVILNPLHGTNNRVVCRCIHCIRALVSSLYRFVILRLSSLSICRCFIHFIRSR
jgi:hypothetical protein